MTMKNKYYEILDRIMATGKTQTNKKGNIRFLLNQTLTLSPGDLLEIFEGHPIARKKLRKELAKKLAKDLVKQRMQKSRNPSDTCV